MLTFFGEMITIGSVKRGFMLLDVLGILPSDMKVQ
jgi:hypothetical protein